MRIESLLFIAILCFTSACTNIKYDENTWREYLGTWQSLDGHEVIISIEEDVRTGRVWEQHALTKIKDLGTFDTLPPYYFVDGTWTWQLGPSEKQRREWEKTNEEVQDGLPIFNVHPFDQFMYRSQTVKNPDINAPGHARYIDKLSYISLIHPDTLIRRNKDNPDVKWLRQRE